ncbi:MAG: hypothetical protein HKN68_16640, partial [Saprospiraceae bacterium]|nr:hypothetical protein [Saprospiraceae bacterium]
MNGNKCSKVAIVLGSAAPVPYRCREAEGVVLNQTITDALAERAAKKAMENARPLSMNNYKLPLFEAIIKQGLLNLV